jgi:hypothetical protein
MTNIPLIKIKQKTQVKIDNRDLKEPTSAAVSAAGVGLCIAGADQGLSSSCTNDKLSGSLSGYILSFCMEPHISV